jgi:ribosome-associated protein
LEGISYERIETLREGSSEPVFEAARAASSKKASGITILDVSALLVITDHFLICSASNERQARTIADEIERRVLAECDIKPARREGERESRWVVLDYVDFVVHVFHEEARDYYDLERLWSDAPVVRVKDLEAADEPVPAEAT